MEIDKDILVNHTRQLFALEQHRSKFSSWHTLILGVIENYPEGSLTNIQNDSFELRAAGITIRFDLKLVWINKDEEFATVIATLLNTVTKKDYILTSFSWKLQGIANVTFNERNIDFLEFHDIMIKDLIYKAYSQQASDAVW